MAGANHQAWIGSTQTDGSDAGAWHRGAWKRVGPPLTRPRPRAGQVRAALVRNKLEVKRSAAEAQGQAQAQAAGAGGSDGAGIEAAVARAEAEAAAEAAGAGGAAGDAKPKDARTLVREAVAAGRMRQGELDERALEFLAKAEPAVAQVRTPLPSSRDARRHDPCALSPWHLHGTSMAPPWHLLGTSLAPPWHLHGTSMAPAWHLLGHLLGTCLAAGGA